MELLLWVVLILRVLRTLTPWVLTIGLAVLVMHLAGPIPSAYALPAFAFAVLLIGSFLRSQVFKQKRPPDQYYRQYPPIRRRLSESNRRKGRSRK